MSKERTEERTKTHARDSINRQATIEHLKKRLIETAINNAGVIARCDSIFEDTADNRIGTWINEVPSAQRWIPVTEALPKRGEVVLWCSAKGGVFTTAITCKDGENWNVWKRHRSAELIAWMPLPEPYREEGGNA